MFKNKMFERFWPALLLDFIRPLCLTLLARLEQSLHQTCSVCMKINETIRASLLSIKHPGRLFYIKHCNCDSLWIQILLFRLPSGTRLNWECQFEVNCFFGHCYSIFMANFKCFGIFFVLCFGFATVIAWNSSSRTHTCTEKAYIRKWERGLGLQFRGCRWR